MLNIELFRNYCLKKNSVSESFPFNETTLVLKVFNKIFALTDLEEDFKIVLKAKPEDVILLIEQYKSISGAYHMNKKHWISIEIDGSLSDNFITELINNSYNLVVSGIPEKFRKLPKN